MHLTKLELAGFKSFAQKVTLEFDRGIVSIVGPNGSGKSNVADAIRWVLGEQSLKLLRGKRSEDVIFSGSTSKARLGMAEVSLHLNNEDRAMPVDFTEVVITRRVFRSGEGEYLMNGQPVRLHDLQLLLARANIGQRSYSVIGQGMIDHILVSSPAERKAFFDEAAGVREFQIKKEDALRKLEATRENLSQAQLLMAEIEPHLRTLTRQVRRLERRGAMEGELKATSETYYRKRQGSLATEKASLETTFAEQTAVVDKHKAALEKLQKELEALEGERSQQEQFGALEREYAAAIERKNALLKEQALLEGSRELEAAKAGELNVVWLENREKELGRELAALEAELTDLRAATKETEGALKAEERERSSLEERIADKEAELAKAAVAARRQSDELPAVTKDLGVYAEELVAFKKALLAADGERAYQKLQGQFGKIDERALSLKTRLVALSGDAGSALAMLHETVAALWKEKLEQNERGAERQKEQERRAERAGVLSQSVERLREERERAGRELARLAPGGAKRTDHRGTLENDLVALDATLKGLREKIVNFNQVEQKKKERLFELQKAFRTEQQHLTAASAGQNETSVRLGKVDTRLDDLAREMREALPEETVGAILADPAVESSASEEQLLADIHRMKHQLELIGGIDESVAGEHKVTEERFTFLEAQVRDLTESLSKLEHIIMELDQTIKKRFHDSFVALSREFSKYFKVLFEGGSGKLVLQETTLLTEEEKEEEEDEGDEDMPMKMKKGEKIVAGVDIIAQPPGKRITGITMLSGGERALTSIALICAIMATRPSPFVVLDEVDAALDEANSQRFAAIIKELARKTQFITISHNRATMQISALLYGVTMSDDGISKLLSIKMEDAAKVIERHGNR